MPINWEAVRLKSRQAAWLTIRITPSESSMSRASAIVSMLSLAAKAGVMSINRWRQIALAAMRRKIDTGRYPNG